MPLRQLLTGAVAAALGAGIGSLIALHWATRFLAQGLQPDRTKRVVAHELVILGDQGRPIVRLGPSASGTSLQFLDLAGKPALEAGISRTGDSRFINFFGKGGEAVAGLISLPPNGETTLYLGDDRWHARIVLGAIRTDTDYATQSIDDWGLEFRQPRSNQAPLSMLMHPSRQGYQTGIRIEREGGKAWTAP
jgi:hypothetical protein